MAGQTETGADADRLLAEVRRLHERLDALEQRLDGLEAERAPRVRPAAPPDRPAARGADPFGPAVERTSGSRHLASVNKALSMLGLVPACDTREPEAERAAAGHKHALGKALEMLGVTTREPQEAPPEPPADAGHAQQEAAETVFAGRWETAASRPDGQQPAVDLETAVAVDLKRHRLTAEDLAVPVLNAAILVVAVGAALFAAGFGTRGAPLTSFELGTGATAALLGGLAFIWRGASQHLRAAATGVSVLALQALAMLLLKRGPQPQPAWLVVLAAGVPAALGLRLVLFTRHPLALFLGLALAVGLQPLLAVGRPFAALAGVVALNAATAWGAVRLRRLQPGLLAALLALVALAGVPPAAAAPFAALLSLLWLLEALVAGALNPRSSRGAVLLALLALALAGVTAHRLYAGGPALARAAGLFAAALVAGLGASRLPRHEVAPRRVLEAGAAALVLSALPLGFSGHALVVIVLLVALAFGVFALLLYDPWVRAAGALVLIVGAAMIARAGTDPASALSVAAVAALLYAVRTRGPDPAVLSLLLGALVLAGLLAGTALLLPAPAVACAWALLALALGTAGERTGIVLMRVCASAAAGAAAVFGLAATEPDAAWLTVTGLALLPHFWLGHPLRRPRRAGLHLLLAETTLFAAAQVGLAGPRGVLVVLPALAVMVLPLWGVAVHTLRAHARFFTLLLLARCLAPDLWRATPATAWLNLRFAAMCGAVLAAGVALARARTGRALTGLLAAAVVALAAGLEAGPVAGAAAGGAAAVLLAVLLVHGRFSAPPRSP